MYHARPNAPCKKMTFLPFVALSSPHGRTTCTRRAICPCLCVCVCGWVDVGVRVCVLDMARGNRMAEAPETTHPWWHSLCVFVRVRMCVCVPCTIIRVRTTMAGMTNTSATLPAIPPNRTDAAYDTSASFEAGMPGDDLPGPGSLSA